MRETLAIIAIGIVAASVGLLAFTYSDTATPPSTQELGTPVKFYELAQGERSTVTRRVNYLITSSGELAKLWRMIETNTEIPSVDFDANHVIAVFAGEQPTEGYEIAVTKVRDSETRRVEVGVTRPGGSCLLAESLTQPYQIIEISKTELPLTHEDVITTTSCLR